MKKMILVALAFVFALGADAKPKPEKEINLRVGTYNIWSPAARRGVIKKGKAPVTRNWDNSKQAVAELIVDLGCDIIALQEVTSVCRDDLATLIKKAGGRKYQLWWVDTYPHTDKKNIGSAVLYNKKKLSLSQQNIYYFSPTPEEVSKGWDEKRFYRASLATVVTHKKSGKKFFFMANHGPLAKTANAQSGKLLVEWDTKYNTNGLPAIVAGDMNARPNSACYKYMCQHYEDCFLVAEKRVGTIGTFNGAKEIDEDKNRRIDHIYIHSSDKGKFKVIYYEVNRDKLDCGGEMHYPSDHNPVFVDLTIR